MAEQITEAEVRALLAAEAKATPGPVRIGEGDPDGFARLYSGSGLSRTLVADTLRTRDAALFVAARNLAAPLASSWLAMREQLAAATKRAEIAERDLCGHLSEQANNSFVAPAFENTALSSECARLEAQLAAMREREAKLVAAVESHIHDLVKHYQPAPFMDGSRLVPPSIERLLQRLESALAAKETGRG